MLTGRCSGRPLVLKEITATSILLTLWWSMAGFEIQASKREAVFNAESILERLKQLEGTWGATVEHKVATRTRSFMSFGWWRADPS